jgi:hypothetical protein
MKIWIETPGGVTYVGTIPKQSDINKICGGRTPYSYIDTDESFALQLEEGIVFIPLEVVSKSIITVFNKVSE